MERSEAGTATTAGTVVVASGEAVFAVKMDSTVVAARGAKASSMLAAVSAVVVGVWTVASILVDVVTAAGGKYISSDISAVGAAGMVAMNSMLVSASAESGLRRRR